FIRNFSVYLECQPLIRWHSWWDGGSFAVSFHPPLRFWEIVFRQFPQVLQPGDVPPRPPERPRPQLRFRRQRRLLRLLAARAGLSNGRSVLGRPALRNGWCKPTLLKKRPLRVRRPASRWGPGLPRTANHLKPGPRRTGRWPAFAV